MKLRQSQMAEEEKKGVESAGGSATIYQFFFKRTNFGSLSGQRVPETLAPEILAKMHAPPKPAYPVASPDTLKEYDAFLFGCSHSAMIFKSKGAGKEFRRVMATK